MLHFLERSHHKIQSQQQRLYLASNGIAEGRTQFQWDLLISRLKNNLIGEWLTVAVIDPSNAFCPCELLLSSDSSPWCSCCPLLLRWMLPTAKSFVSESYVRFPPIALGILCQCLRKRKRKERNIVSTCKMWQYACIRVSTAPQKEF